MTMTDSQGVGTDMAQWAADRLAMQDALSRYSWGYDEGDFDMLADIRGAQTDQRRHTFHTFRFENQSATSADAYCYVIITSTEAGEPQTLTAGTYHATMSRDDDGQWRIADLTACLDGPF